jgi:hypothetical protein
MKKMPTHTPTATDTQHGLIPHLAGGWVSGDATSPGFSTSVDRISFTWDCQTRHSPGTLWPMAKKHPNTKKPGFDRFFGF